jgi:ribose transport system substrate-binding protein
MNTKRFAILMIVLLLLSLVTGASLLAQDDEEEDYLENITRRQEEMYDTSAFAKDPPYRIALAAQGPTNSWALLFDEHVRNRVEELGPDVVEELLYADAQGSADIQVPQVEDLLAQDPDVLILTPMGAAALSAPVERAMAQGVPVVLCASGVDTDNFVTEINANPFQIGYNLMEWLIDELDGEGNIVMMTGIPGVPTAVFTEAGALEILEDFPNINVLDSQPGNWSTSDGKRVMEQWLAQYGDEIDGIWANGAQMSMGIIQAYVEAGLDTPPLAGGEYMNGFLRLAAEHDVDFYAGQFPAAMSVLCVDVAVRILQGEDVPRFHNITDYIEETRDFTHEDLDDFYNAAWSDDVFGPVFLSEERMIELGFFDPEMAEDDEE